MRIIDNLDLTESQNYTLEPIAVQAERLQVDVKIAQPYELFIDCDSPEELAEFVKRWDVCSALYPLGHYDVEPSRSEGHSHVIVTMPHSLPVVDRILLQSILGSHFKKELYSWLRWNAQHQLCVVLFKPRKETEKCQMHPPTSPTSGLIIS